MDRYHSPGERIVVVPSHRFYGKLCVAVVDDAGNYEEVGHYGTASRALAEAQAYQRNQRPDLELKVGRQ